MSSPCFPFDPNSLTIDTKTARAAAAPHAEAYQSAAPYPHGCIDNFLPEEVLERVRADIATLPEAEHSFDRAQERLKTSYNPERLPEYTRNLFHAFNARPFVLFFEELMGTQC